jgi:hypothetical protein
MADDAAGRTRDLIDHLRAQGHPSEADSLASHLSIHSIEHGLLFALREALETVLTGIEAIDPVTQTMVEELRVEVETRLGSPAAKPGT